MKLPILAVFAVFVVFLSARAEESAPAAWPRYHAKVAKDSVNFRVGPSLKARLAPVRPPKGTELSVQRASENDQWLEILDPEEYRGFYVRADMATLGAQEQ
jgi:SH3-like domain-containing protein